MSCYLGKVDYEFELKLNKEIILHKPVYKSIKFENHPNGKYMRFVKVLKEMVPI